MNRRDSLKHIAAGALGLAAYPTGLLATEQDLTLAEQDLLAAEAEGPGKKIKIPGGRTEEEAIRDAKLKAEVFFTPHELRTVGVLADIIVPADEVSGSATQAGVPAFIEFMMKDQPQHQTPMRGGLMWLDNLAMKRFGKKFVEGTPAQQIDIVDDIAYPEAKPKPGMAPGIAFFSLLRNFVMTGFYTSEMGYKDIGYLGNRPNQWEGVPADVLAQYGF
jgi:gluconate 2-dehydrogenase gamma chain